MQTLQRRFLFLILSVCDTHFLKIQRRTTYDIPVYAELNFFQLCIPIHTPTAWWYTSCAPFFPIFLSFSSASLFPLLRSLSPNLHSPFSSIPSGPSALLSGPSFPIILPLLCPTCRLDSLLFTPHRSPILIVSSFLNRPSITPFSSNSASAVLSSSSPHQHPRNSLL